MDRSAEQTTKACPACGVGLVRLAYEGFPVFHCPKCRGHLVTRHRELSINRSHRRSAEQLMKDAVAEGQPDTTRRLSCPRCHAKMKKRHVPRPADFTADCCESCDLVWFDGGELARAQLAYEISPKGREAAELEQRMANMPPGRQQEFEANLAKLPAGDTTLIAAMLSAMDEEDE